MTLTMRHLLSHVALLTARSWTSGTWGARSPYLPCVQVGVKKGTATTSPIAGRILQPSVHRSAVWPLFLHLREVSAGLWSPFPLWHRLLRYLLETQGLRRVAHEYKICKRTNQHN
jgi:hypothetical protein